MRTQLCGEGILFSLRERERDMFACRRKDKVDRVHHPVDKHIPPPISIHAMHIHHHIFRHLYRDVCLGRSRVLYTSAQGKEKCQREREKVEKERRRRRNEKRENLIYSLSMVT